MAGVDDVESIAPSLLRSRIDLTRDPVHVVVRMLQQGMVWIDILTVVRTPTKTSAIQVE